MDRMIYNDLLTYAKLIENSDIANYLKSIDYMNEGS